MKRTMGWVATGGVILTMAAACSSGLESTTGSTTPTTSTARPAKIDFRPVLTISVDGSPPDPAFRPAGTDLVVNFDGARYDLGAPLAGGELFESAEAGLSPDGQWVVEPVFKSGPQGIDMFNAAAEACFSLAPACPMGHLAILIDGELISAPKVNEPRFERDQIQLSGDWTEQEARELAARINGDG